MGDFIAILFWVVVVGLFVAPVPTLIILAMLTIFFSALNAIANYIKTPYETPKPRQDKEAPLSFTEKEELMTEAYFKTLGIQ